MSSSSSSSVSGFRWRRGLVPSSRGGDPGVGAKLGARSPCRAWASVWGSIGMLSMENIILDAESAGIGQAGGDHTQSINSGGQCWHSVDVANIDCCNRDWTHTEQPGEPWKEAASREDGLGDSSGVESLSDQRMELLQTFSSGLPLGNAFDGHSIRTHDGDDVDPSLPTSLGVVKQRSQVSDWVHLEDIVGLYHAVWFSTSRRANSSLRARGRVDVRVMVGLDSSRVVRSILFCIHKVNDKTPQTSRSERSTVMDRSSGPRAQKNTAKSSKQRLSSFKLGKGP
ncbi:hypothetical protein F5148DRAFT_1367645 [Russula earlei]|uniref:Uncharacterized protein n=1 Tax=Russula earlei TaxID=71964 RepID=A0ACC0UAF6_9AGAM|nr:hypothetical protein F5148DRAFT_1367645 [Russula earlei]